ncbi:transglycosylase domain-containing protein [Streptomyces sp. ISL-96]|uniref:transglycosylase domain-containing protein n=1 Tax=Streptomyces sp. ISL-96 TaxID=2819191 RepID=UPI001BE6A15D|nr:transglycosylase domain-containing protein [Streptomyces sp. ISL-96]MBT2489173.1 transglycosylase domain-containing protein [Streptomyces sp. ISL-96]
MGRAEARKDRQRGARRAKKAGGIRRFFTLKKMLGTFFGLCLLMMGVFVALYIWVPVPTANAQAEMQSNVYKYSNGKIMARSGKVNREIVPLANIPKGVQTAFVAAENKNFYSDSGVDLKGTARGLLNTVTGKGKQGGSTITQQYVKNYYLTQEQTVSRKLKELVISIKVDRKQSKSDILAGYLNTSYFGRGAYGIQAAAQAYYGVDADKLTVTQGAYLAALLQAPSQYDWAVAGPTSQKLVTERWNYVLNNMVEMKALDQAKRDTLKFDIPRNPKGAAGMEGQTGYMVDAAKAELEKQGVTDAEFDAGGWTITLNIDEKRQKSLEKAVERQLESKLDREKNKVDATLQAGATSVDPKTGKVVAMYGGVDATEHYFSNATRSDYQPASTFKPVVLAAALESNSKTQDGEPITPSTIYDGTSKRPVEGSTTPFAPQNDLGKSYGPITVQQAMNKSVNSVFAQMLVDVGPSRVKETALRMGMEDKGGFDERPAMSLGVMGASTMDMASVYATLDNHGKKVTPTIVKSAEHKDREGGRVDLPKPAEEQVIDRSTADSVTKVLTGVVNSGTGFRASSPHYNAAGKTGTSEKNRSAWFVGYTPELSTAVALFGESTKPGGGQVSLTGTANAGRASGGGFPASIWADYTLGALGGGSDADFDLEIDPDDTYSPPPTNTPDPSNTPSTPATTPSTPPTSPSTTPPTSPSTTPPTSPSTTPSTSPPPITLDPPDPGGDTEGSDGGADGGGDTGGSDGGSDGGADGGADGGSDGGANNDLRPPRP